MRYRVYPHREWDDTPADDDFLWIDTNSLQAAVVMARHMTAVTRLEWAVADLTVIPPLGVKYEEVWNAAIGREWKSGDTWREMMGCVLDRPVGAMEMVIQYEKGNLFGALTDESGKSALRMEAWAHSIIMKDPPLINVTNLITN